LKLLEEHRSSRVDHHVRLWMLLNVAVWHALYVEEEERETLAEQFAAAAGKMAAP
jgi:hypothetical protein